MNNKKDLWKVNAFIILALSIFILSSINVHALGIAPSRKVVDYSSSEQSYTVRIINNENRDMRLVVYAQGDLAEYVTIEKNTINVLKSEGEKGFTYSVKLPDNLEPGEHKINIIVMEVPDKVNIGEESQTTILSTLSVAHQLIVNVAYPGVFAEGVLYISEANVNDTLTFTVNVLNKGTQEIQNINGEVIIRGPTNDEITRVKSETITRIDSGQAEKLVANLVANMNPGLYAAEFIVNYNDKQFVLRNNFRVGSKSIDIDSITVENFKLGTIAKFDVNLLNNWNQPVSSVYADMKVLNSQSVEVASFRTAPIELMQLSRGTITGYWDTREVDVGTYDIKVILNYDGTSIERIFKTVVGIDSIKLQDPALSGQVISSQGEGNKLSLLYILVLISIVFNIGLFVYFKFMRKKNQVNP